MDYIKTVEELPVFFPVFEATIRVTSERLVDFEPFTRFVFQMIGNGENLEAIEQITELKTPVILEEIHRLQGWGFFEERDATYHLTELGHRYLKLMMFIDNINEEMTKVLVNAFNGKITEMNKELLKADECIPRLKVNVVRELIQNKNFSNSQSFFMENICFTHAYSSDFTRAELESIQVWIDCEPQTRYYRSFIKEVPAEKLEKGLIEPYDLAIQAGVVPITFVLHHELLEENKHILPTLKQLNQFNPDLLSEKSLKLIELQEHHAKAQAKIPKYYYDQLTGRFVSTYADYDVKGHVFKLKFDKTNMPDKQALQELFQQIDFPYEFDIDLKQENVLKSTTLLSSWMLT